MFRRSVVVIVASIISVLLAGPAWAYIAPVEGPITDHFRKPANEYSAGNRGIDYQLNPGEIVRASESGKVSFAGQVGGKLYVVIAHDDGLKTTYGGLQSVFVAENQLVVKGEKVATGGGNFHFGIKRGDEYLDPELLFENRGAHLVPVT